MRSACFSNTILLKDTVLKFDALFAEEWQLECLKNICLP